VPIRLQEAVSVQRHLPPGAAAVLINQAHTDPDLYLPITAQEKEWVEAINGKRTIDDIVDSTKTGDSNRRHREHARGFFERLWWYDQVVFDTSRETAPGAHVRASSKTAIQRGGYKQGT
jgi:hypothetical protein